MEEMNRLLFSKNVKASPVPRDRSFMSPREQGQAGMWAVSRETSWFEVFPDQVGNAVTCHSLLISLTNFIFPGVIQQFHESKTMDWEAIKKNSFSSLRYESSLLLKLLVKVWLEKATYTLRRGGGGGQDCQGGVSIQGRKTVRAILTVPMWFDCISQLSPWCTARSSHGFMRIVSVSSWE